MNTLPWSTVEDIGQAPVAEPVSSGRVSEELNKIEVTRDKVLEIAGSVRDKKSTASDGTHLIALKQVRYDVALLIQK